MDEFGRPYMTRGADAFETDAYLDVVTQGYGYPVTFDGQDIDLAKGWLSDEGIDFCSSLCVFGFREKEDSERFASRFGDWTHRPH